MSISQQAFLRDAMRRLNLTRDVFATRIGVKRRALDTWLLPEGSQEFRAMPEVVQRFVSVTALPSKARISCCRWTNSPAIPSKTCSASPT